MSYTTLVGLYFNVSVESVRLFIIFLLFSGNVGLSYVRTTAGMWYYRSKKPFTPLICVICVNQWQLKLLATVCASSGGAINIDLTDSGSPIVIVFAGLASCFQPTRRN
nr:hypothetical protein GZ31B6_6 [uncultured archaeon GZfos31B6]